jgi:inhibitor of KinA
LGDTAILVDFGNRIDKTIHLQVMALYDYLQLHPLKGTTDLIPAYTSLAICYDPAAYLAELNEGMPVAALLAGQLTAILATARKAHVAAPRLVEIPVCYEGSYAPDISVVAAAIGKTQSEIITLHTSTVYHVYMLGFLPGFAYMGEVNALIAQPRKPRPVPIAAGSVGIAGRQTGIYPLASPGGWQIIGRTPLSLFQKETGHTLLQPGDQVQFYPINSHEFKHY